jgi:hypothetical protein
MEERLEEKWKKKEVGKVLKITRCGREEVKEILTRTKLDSETKEENQ